jgi:hypothetical protein
VGAGCEVEGLKLGVEGHDVEVDMDMNELRILSVSVLGLGVV